MDTHIYNRLAALLFCCGLMVSSARAQQERIDPTAAPAAMADALRAQLAEFRAISIHALAVGSDDDGVAILNTGSAQTTLARATRNNAPTEGAIVRTGSAIVMETSGISLRLIIKSVTSKGVEIEAPTLTEKLFIPGSFKAIAPTNTLSSAHLRYLECKDLPVETLLRLIADQTGANLSASSKASKEPISVFLRNVSADQAVEEICRTRGLWFRKDEATGITRVTTMTEYEENLSSFREEAVESFTLLYPNVLEVASVIYGLYPERVMLSLGEEEIQQDEERDINRRLERLNIFSSASGSGLLNNQAGGSSGYNSGYGSGYGYTSGGYGYNGGGYGNGAGGGYGGRLGNSLLMQGSRDGQNTVIDMRTRQQFGKLTQNDAKELDRILRQPGTNTTGDAAEAYREKNANIFVTISRRNNLLVVRTGDPEVMKEIRDLVRRLDVPTPMVLLEIKVLQLSINNDLTASFAYEFNKNYSVNSKKVQTTTGFPGFDPLSTAANSDALSFQLLSDHLNARIQLLEKDGHVRTLATPSLLTANNEASRLFIGEERPMVKNITSQTVVNDNNTVTTPQTETELQLVGTMLLITPNINADRTVTLRLMQENSKILKDDATIPIATSQGTVQNVAIDVVSSRSVAGTFVAKDEMIVAVGGMIEENEENQQSKIPVLGSIPYLGWFFRSTEKVKTRSELILLIKPHVISTPAEGEAISQRVMKDISAHPAADGRPSMFIYKNDPNAITNRANNVKKDN